MNLFAACYSFLVISRPLEINLENQTKVALSARVSGLDVDLEGNLYICSSSGAVFRLGPHETVATIFFDKGELKLATIGQKERRESVEMKVGCLDARGMSGYIWLGQGLRRELVKYSISSDEVELLSVRDPEDEEDESGDSGATSHCISSIIAVCDHFISRIYIMSARSLLSLDLATQEVCNLWTCYRTSSLVHPSLLEPFHDSPNHGKGDRRYRFTWALGREKETFLVELDTGASTRISSARLRPLVTLAPHLTLVAEDLTLDTVWISLVRWTTPTGSTRLHPGSTSYYIVPASDIKRICPLNHRWYPGSENLFAFDPSNNQLYALNAADSWYSITRYSHFLQGVASLLYFSEPQSTNFRPNLVSLLNAPLIPHDTTIVHEASGYRWFMHSKLITCHNGLETADLVNSRLLPVILRSSLPQSSIQTFMEYLYFGDVDTSDLDRAFTETCNLVQLCTEVGLDCDYPLVFLQDRIINNFTTKRLLQVTMEHWFSNPDSTAQYTDTTIKPSPIMCLLADRIRFRANYAEISESMRDFEAPNLLTESEFRALMDTLGDIIAPNEPFRLLVMPTMSDQAPNMPPVAVKWDSNLVPSDLSSSTADEHAFAFSIEGEPGGVIVKSWLLYARWSWFERLIKSELEESRTRHVVMPAWVHTREMLLAILAAACGSLDEAHVSCLSAEDVSELFHRGPELQLDANPAFSTLLGWCRLKILENAK